MVSDLKSDLVMTTSQRHPNVHLMGNLAVLKINLPTNQESYKQPDTTSENVSKIHPFVVCVPFVKLFFCDLFFITSPKMALKKAHTTI